VVITDIIANQENIMDRKTSMKYHTHKSGAKARGIPFLLSKEEWWDIWQKSGKWDQRGNKRGQYVMSRYGDQGPYAIGNVFIQPQVNNISEAHLGKKVPLCTEEYRINMSKIKKGVKSSLIKCTYCDKIGGSNVMHRWHMDNCKAINIK